MSLLVGAVLGWILGTIMMAEHFEKKVKAGLVPCILSDDTMTWKEKE